MPGQSNSRKRKRKPRPPIFRREPTEWRNKIHPFFIRLAERYKKIVQLSRSGSEEDRQESQRLIRNPQPEMVDEAQRVGDEFRRSGKLLGTLPSAIFRIDGRFPATHDISDEDYMLAWFAWNRYRKTFKQLLEDDRNGVRQSSMRVVAISRDYQRWRYKELDPEKAKFKLDREHQVLIQYGLAFGVGLLSAEVIEFLDAASNK
jgi:hypothetical protein